MASEKNSTSVASNDWRDVLTSDLFSNLDPLLALFGEQVTTQFLSLSMGWGDSIMLSMAPIGLLTIIVSSVRVTKQRWLKALVGR